MESLRLRDGSFRKCSACHGQILTVSFLRSLGQKQLAAKWWQQALACAAEHRIERTCPTCEQRLIAIAPEQDPRGDVLAACKTCQSFWIGEPLPGLDQAHRVDYQLSPEAEARLMKQDFSHVPNHTESDSVLTDLLDSHDAAALFTIFLGSEL